MLCLGRKLTNVPVLSSFKISICLKALMSSDDCFTVKQIGAVTCLGFNRPEKKNCLNVPMVNRLMVELDKFEKNPDSNVAVLYGERGNFSYGLDQEELSENPNLGEDIEKIGLLNKFCTKPVVAAVSGLAVGHAFDIALWCDFMIVEDTAVLACYARKSGYPASQDRTTLLFNHVGIRKALDWLLTGRIVTPKEALEYGVATRLVACGTGLGQSLSFANSLNNMPQACLKADRASLYSIKKNDENIISELKRNRAIALKEVFQGVHVTNTGDVRRTNR